VDGGCEGEGELIKLCFCMHTDVFGTDDELDGFLRWAESNRALQPRIEQPGWTSALLHDQLRTTRRKLRRERDKQACNNGHVAWHEVT